MYLPSSKQGVRSFSGQAVAVLVTCILLVLAPFAGALAIHHELAAVDHDGHQHSEFDLCQWVQHNTSGSVLLDLPAVESFLIPGLHQFPEPAALLPVRLVRLAQPRAPPLS